MSDEVKGYDRGRSFRLVLVEGPRVRGTFAVFKPQPGKKTWVMAHDVTVYDESRTTGRVLYSNAHGCEQQARGRARRVGRDVTGAGRGG